MLLVLEIMLVALLITLPVIRFSRRAVTLFRAQELSVSLPVKLSKSSPALPILSSLSEYSLPSKGSSSPSECLSSPSVFSSGPGLSRSSTPTSSGGEWSGGEYGWEVVRSRVRRIRKVGLGKNR
jgi:hypothetical protein